MRQDKHLDAQQWRRYIEHEIGFVLPDIQLQWLVNAVNRTVAAHGMTVSQLWQELPLNLELRQYLLDRVLILESRFFRHMPSIAFVTDYAKQYAASNIDADTDDEKVFRVWSVGCATGQEAWSLAMSLAANQLTHYTVLGTDISQKAIAIARQGHYSIRQQQRIPASCQAFIDPVPLCGSQSANSNLSSSVATSRSQWQITPILREKVDFALHNVITQTLPTTRLQQVIICQNMLMYFRKFDQRDILNRLSMQCALDGYIILAPGEALFWRPSNMRRIAHPQINAWQKISA